MAIQSGKVGVSPKDVTLSGRVKGFDPNVYLTKEEAALTYLTIIASNSFLTQALASATYQTIADMVNYQLKLISGTTIKRINGEDLLGSGSISVLTNEIASGIYQTIEGMSNYALKSEIPSLTEYVKKAEAPGYTDILTKTLAQTTYMPLNKIASASELGGVKVGSGLSIDANGVLSSNGGGGDLSAYVSKAEAPGYSDILTQTVASATYQTIANMANYVTIANAPGYDDILTRTVASTTYQTIANMSNYVTNNTIASSSQLGLVKVGSGLSIDPNGVLSATGGSGIVLGNPISLTPTVNKGSITSSNLTLRKSSDGRYFCLSGYIIVKGAGSSGVENAVTMSLNESVKAVTTQKREYGFATSQNINTDLIMSNTYISIETSGAMQFHYLCTSNNTSYWFNGSVIDVDSL